MIGIHPINTTKPNAWTPQEDALLLENKHLTVPQAIELFAKRFPDRTAVAIKNRRWKLKAGRFTDTKRRLWTEADFAFMRDNPNLTDTEMAYRLGAKLSALTAARKRADIRKVYRCHKCDVLIGFQGVYCIEHQSYARKLAAYHDKAKKRGFEFSLSRDAFHDLLEGNCHYCGGTGGGIDRVDSKIGYVQDNTVSCCWSCNAMKSNVPYDAWIEHIKKIISHTEKRS